mgnify:CR=1 FL=1
MALVIVPETALVPPIILELPSCSKSIEALLPVWSIYISLSAITDKDNKNKIY